MLGKKNNADKSGFVKVVDTYQSPLLRYVARLLHNTSAADDVVQKTFIKCLLHWNGIMAPSDDLAAWLYRIAHNEALDFLRYEKRRFQLHINHSNDPTLNSSVFSDKSSVESIDDDASAAAEAMEIVLTEQERQIVALKVYEEKSYKEISKITGLAISNVGVVLHNAMKKLAKHLAGKKGDL